MIHLNSNEFKEIIHASVFIRGTGAFGDAINLVEERLAEMHPDCLLNAYLEIFYAAREGGLAEKAQNIAKILDKLQPGLPSVQPFLQ